MTMPLADVLDRLSILYLKKWVGGQDDLDDEIKRYEIAMREAEIPDDWLIRLTAYNALVWSAESDIRRDVGIPLAEIGRRAVNIRDFNKLRVGLKADISRACGDQPDVKVNHGSA